MSKDRRYRVDSLSSLPQDIDLVWHGVNDEANLRQFMSADVPWGELDINIHSNGRDLILRHDSYAELPQWAGERPLLLRDVLPRLVDADKSIKLDFKAGKEWHEAILEIVDQMGLQQDRLWLNADLDVFGEAGLHALSERYPDAILQIPLHSLPGWRDDMQTVYRELDQVTAAGVNRFSVGWRYPDVPSIIATLSDLGHEANIYGVRNLDEFLQAVELRPKSITADFNFPEWRYYGRGSGHAGHFWRYQIANYADW